MISSEGSADGENQGENGIRSLKIDTPHQVVGALRVERSGIGWAKRARFESFVNKEREAV